MVTGKVYQDVNVPCVRGLRSEKPFLNCSTGTPEINIDNLADARHLRRDTRVPASLFTHILLQWTLACALSVPFAFTRIRLLPE